MTSGWTPLPGWAIDLATDGVIASGALTRSDVVKAARQIMLSAHRHGHSDADIHALLTDTRRYKLARQIVTGRGGRGISSAARERFLQQHWEETRKVAAQRPTWSREDALDFIDQVSESLGASIVPDTDRKVMEAAIGLARKHTTSRPALPVREIADLTGLSTATAHRVLTRLANTGDWLGLAKRGNRHTRMASLYNLAPVMAQTYTGASPPMSHPPTSHEREDQMTATFELTKDELAVVLRMRAAADEAAIDAGQVAIGEKPSNNVSPLRRRSEGSR